MRRFLLFVAALTAGALLLTPAAVADPIVGDIDVSGVEAAGGIGALSINVFGTVDCAAAGPVDVDVVVTQLQYGGVAAGGHGGLVCPAPGAQIKWVVTAVGGGFVIGEKVVVDAIVAGAAVATDAEEHVLRWGR